MCVLAFLCPARGLGSKNRTWTVFTACRARVCVRVILDDQTSQINRVGMAMDYGLCKGKRKDGGPCTMPVNKAEGGGYCEFHVVAAFNRAQRKEPLRSISKGGSGNSNSSNSNSNSKLNSTANFLAAGNDARR